MALNASELRDKTPDELRDQLVQLKKEAFNLRFQQATNQLENTARMRIVRRDDSKSTGGLPVDFQDIQLSDSDALYEELESFFARVRDRGAPAVSGEDGREALAGAIMIAESLQAHHDLLRKSGLIGT